MNVSFKTIGAYFQTDKTFVVPNYQRGYKWAVQKNGKPSAVETLMDNLIDACNKKNPDYFIQGVTVCEEGDEIILIDGQQRTTTLYLLLWYLKYESFSKIKLDYKIRKKSEEFIHDLTKKEPQEYIVELEDDKREDDNQDIYYFKEAILQIDSKLKEKDDEEKVKISDYILDNVKIIYIPIHHPKKAIKTFTMMNGNKADMLGEELIKAEMLRIISLPDNEQKEVSTSVDENLVELKEIIAKDWEINALRSRYAREWDKWLYWWNRKEVKNFFNVKTKVPMGLLLKYCYPETVGEKQKIDFHKFKKLIDKTTIKECFGHLREWQKSFEDMFNDAIVYNWLGLSLITVRDEDDKYKIIKHFKENIKHKKELENYAKWRLVGATHLEITDLEKSKSETTKEERAKRVMKNLESKIVYGPYDDDAYKQLLRLNVEEDNRQGEKGRKFDFSIWGEKSLEHIHSKSKVYYSKIEDGIKTWYRGDEEGKLLTPKEKEEIIFEINEVRNKNLREQDRIWLNRASFKKNGSEHCIGNLVLLYNNENSVFSNGSFYEKKKIYFNIRKTFKSRHLLHTISVFAEDKWGVAEIQKNKNTFIEGFKEKYKEIWQ